MDVQLVVLALLAQRPPTQRVLDFGFAVTALVFAGRIVGEMKTTPEVVPLALVSLHVVIAALFLVRAPARRNASWLELIGSLPAVAIGAIALSFAPAPTRWPRVAVAVFLGGAGLAVASAIALGRSFAVLPAYRTVVARGPYRWLRHPLYLGEIGIVLGATIANATTGAIVRFLLAIGFIAVRIQLEENLLRDSTSDYAEYSDRVRWRLLPGLW